MRKRRYRRGGRRKHGFKLKLKNTTIYNLFGIGSFLGVGLLAMSFTKSGESLSLINDLLGVRFGGAAFLLPLLLFFVGFFFLHIKKFFLSKPTVMIGFLIFFVSIIGLTKSGT